MPVTTLTGASTGTTTPTAAPATTYTVRAGDSLSTICASLLPAMDVPSCVAAVVELNRLGGPDQIAAGQALTLPSGSSLTAPNASAASTVAPGISPTTAAGAGAASTPVPVSTVLATATVIPTAPTVVVSATPDNGVDAYIEALEPAIDLYGASLDLLTVLYEAPNLNDPAWRSDAGEASAALVNAGKEIRAADPPACLQDAHGKFLSAASQFDNAARNIDSGVAQNDSGLLTTAGNQLQTASATLGDAIDTANATGC